MKKTLILGLWFAANFCLLSAHAKEWCAVPGKGGYFADKCPTGTQSTNIDAPKQTPQRWEPKIGMTAAEVLEKTRDRTLDISPKWFGGPRDINTTKTAHGVHEQWVFGSGYGRWYIYFDNDILTAIQE